MLKSALGLAALVLGVAALGLAIIPAIVFETPPPWNRSEPKPPQPRIEGQKSVEWRGIKVAWGGKAVKEAPPEQPAMNAAKWFAIATAAISLVGLALGPLAWWRERRYALAAPGMSFCCLALTWQYLILGIVVGAAAAAFLVALAMLSRAVSA